MLYVYWVLQQARMITLYVGGRVVIRDGFLIRDEIPVTKGIGNRKNCKYGLACSPFLGQFGTSNLTWYHFIQFTTHLCKKFDLSIVSQKKKKNVIQCS